MNSTLKDVKHVSFDVWNTLVSPNPVYAAARNQYLALVFNKPVEEVKAGYTKVKRIFDKAAEDSGESTAVHSVFARLFKEMGADSYQIMDDVRMGCHALFRRYPPLVPEGLDKMLLDLQKAGYTTSIASNTNFICGELMRDVVFNWLETDFHFQLYSDELGYSKPHMNFFLQIGINASQAQIDEHGYYKLGPRNILHVGDNQICDIDGAKQEHMQSLLVANPDDTVARITELLLK